MQRNASVAALYLITTMISGYAGPAARGFAANQKLWLSDLDISLTQQGWSEPKRNTSVENNPLRIGGRTFEHGLGTHADSALFIRLDGGSCRFTAWVGVDDEVARHGSVEFRMLADGKEIYHSGILKGGEPAQPVDVDVSGVDMLVLVADSGSDDVRYDHAEWAMSGNGAPKSAAIAGEPRAISSIAGAA